MQIENATVAPEQPSSPRRDDHFRTDHLTTDLKGRAVRGITVTLAAQVLKFVISLGSTMILARLLSPSDYGLLAMVAVITGFASVLRDGGLSVATIQRADITEEQISTLFWINATLGLALTAVIIAISPLVAWFFKNPQLTMITVGMAFPFFLSGITVQHQALLQRQMKFSVVAFIEVTSLALSAGIGLICAAAGLRYWSLVIMANAFSLCMAVLVLFFVRWKPRRASRNVGVRSMLEFGGVLTANNLFNSFGGNADKLLLGKFYPASIVGLYTRAQTLMLQPLSQFMPAVQNVVLPVMSRLAERPEKLKEVFLDTLRVTAFACSFMTVFLVVASDWLVLVFLGPKWIEAGAILRLLAGPAFVIPLNALCVLCLTVQGKSGLLLRWGIINNVLTILAIAAGVLWGAEGVAAALTLIALLVLAPYLTYLASKAGPASWPEIIGALGPGTAACAVGCIVLFSVRKALGLHSAPVGLAVLFALSCVYHALVMSLLPSGRRSLAGMRDVASSFRRMKAAPDTSAA